MSRIPIGKTRGVFVFNKFVISDSNVPNQKNNARDLNMGNLYNDPKWQKEKAKYNNLI